MKHQLCMSLNFIFLLGVWFGPMSAGAYDPKDRRLLAHETPAEMQGLKVQEQLGRQLNLSAEFTDESGKLVTLGSFFDGHRPVLMAMVYYTCPSLCNFQLNGLLEGFKKINLVAGRDFQVVAVSMNHRETHEVAGAKKQSYLEAYGKDGAADGWHFLTGSEAQVQSLASELGFPFRWDEVGQQYAHPAVAYVATPGGQLSRYLYGIEFPPESMKLALIEASKGKIGTLVDQLVLFCFQFDPAKNKYTLYAFNVMRLGAVLTAILLALVLIPTWLREKRKAA